ncbi:MAG: TIGR04282 family arsenosugar biosynthesis glycosyltransferase [Sulfuriferula sp.]
MKPVRIVIFTKAPQSGFAKTRLIPALGVQGAADLAQLMFTHTVTEALAAQVGPVELCVTPAAADAAWGTLAIPDTIQWSDQGEGDLGTRLARTTQRVIDGGESILLIGTDCPELTANHLQQAANTLQYFDSTLIPTADGGYVLLGLNHFHPFIFSNIAWSTDTVAFETLCRIGQLRWSVTNQPMLHDIDEPDDLKWLPANWTETLHA